MSTRLKCPYCCGHVPLVTGVVIYPHRQDLRDKYFYLCKPCNAYVGCHPGSKNPLGRLANAELRQAKIAAHEAFDPIWRSGLMRRQKAYGWLSKQLSKTKNETHIGMFDVQTCKRVIQVCNQMMASKVA